MAGTVLVILISLVLAALLLRALCGPKEAPDVESLDAARLTRSLQRRDRLLRALRSARMHHATGELNAAEFTDRSRDLERRIVEAMQDLDRLRERRARFAPRRASRLAPHWKERVEARVRERKESC